MMFLSNSKRSVFSRHPVYRSWNCYSGCKVPHRGKIIKNRLTVFKRGGNLLQNGVLHFVFRFSQLSEIKLQS